jgi:predicted enzyme related to lactoylglutathione lyase
MVGALALAAAGCTTGPPLPPITSAPTGQITPGRVVWHDLVTRDLYAAKRFYGQLLGWTFRDFDAQGGKYALASLYGEPVAGIFLPSRREVNNSQWVSYFSVEDVDGSVAQAQAGGARVAVAPRDIPGRGRAALLVDPEGAPFAVARPTGGDPPMRPPPLNNWLFVDLWTCHPEAAPSFYGSLFHLQLAAVQVEGRPSVMLERGGRPFAGVVRIPQGQPIQPNWLPLLRVADVKAIAARVPGLDGRVLLAPRPEVMGGKVAIISDPSGAAVAVLEWSEPEPSPPQARGREAR